MAETSGPLSVLSHQVALVNTQWGMNNTERLKHVEVMRDLTPMLSSVDNFMIGSIRFIGSRVNGFGNWNANLDVVVQYEEQNTNNILNNIEMRGKISKHFVVLHIDFNEYRPKIKVCHILTGIDVYVFVTTSAPEYNLKLKNTCLMVSYNKQNPEFARVFLIYKWFFSKTNVFCEELGGLSTYGHLILYINFLRLKLLAEYVEIDSLTVNKENRNMTCSAPALFIKFLGYLSMEDITGKIIFLDKDPVLCYSTNPSGKLDLRAVYSGENIATSLTPLTWKKYRRACHYLFTVLRNQDNGNRLNFWEPGTLDIGPDGLASVRLGKIQKQVSYICGDNYDLYE